MKKLFLLVPAAALALTFSGCKKDDVAEGGVQSVSSTYKALVWEYSATWCNPCGVYGYPAMHEIMADNKYKVSGVFLHPSDDIIDVIPNGQEDIKDFFGWGGTPSGACNVGPDTYPGNQLASQVTTAINANGTAKAGIGISHTIDGNVMTINTKSVFFNDMTGTYNLAVYVTESKIQNTQNGQTGVVEHNNIFRGSVGTSVWGTSLGVNPVKGTKVDGTYTFTIPSDVRNKENLQVVAVIYKMEAGEPTLMVNSNTF